MGTDNQTMHHLRAEIQGTVEWYFSEGASSAANAILLGYLHMGNFLGAEIKSDPKRTTTLKASRGIVFEGGSTGAGVSLGLEFMTKEVADMRKAKIALMAAAGTAFTQAAIAAGAIDTLAFTADIPAKLNYDYPLTKRARCCAISRQRSSRLKRGYWSLARTTSSTPSWAWCGLLTPPTCPMAM